jgi:GMP synthase (glutamine-hydrolysing)
MKIHYLQHGATEGPGLIADWAIPRGNKIAGTHFYRGELLPASADFDWLVVMGGPMNVYEYRAHPWLRDEKRLIAQSIEQGKTVIGVCLGAQLIADVLGAKVYQNPEIEIGWFPVRFLDTRKSVRCFDQFPSEITALHWHGDTFDLPNGAIHLAESDACKHQAFAWGEKVVGLQFHIEVAGKDLVEFIGETLPPTAPHIQRREEILAGAEKSQPIKIVLETMLDRLAE